ncbi:preprotein translocase subunit Sec61beta [Candidatus Woesearchaeota archaeon]|nr:MAG: preprotein translocase subunit Sec61beta [Candidatus Woesearchaeota archaeon]
MSRDNKVNMPASTAGITRYFDDYKSKISIKPEVVIVLIIVVIILVLVLSAWGNSWLA